MESGKLKISIADLRIETAARFGVPEKTVRVIKAPYRICPLGAHVDHQLGRVTSMAIDQAINVAFAPSASRDVRFVSDSFEGSVEFSLDSIPQKQSGDWGNLVRGAVSALQQAFNLQQGVVGIVSGSLAECGLSSSAALGLALLMAIENVNNINVSLDDNIMFDQVIENSYLGLQTGILDQSAILLARRGELTCVDCFTNQCESIVPAKLTSNWRILLAFSGVTKCLESTDYNIRVNECTEAARTLLKAVGRPFDRPVLRNIHPLEYAAHQHELSGAPARRALHYFSEAARVESGLTAWRDGNLSEFGHLMTASGASSIANYECGVPPLVVLYDLLISSPGVYGARISGAGFRGCCAAIVQSDAAEDIANRIEACYRARYPEFSDQTGTLICQSDNGARFI